MKNFKQFLLIYIIGSLGYAVLEVLYRGYTHWTMVITGGICFSLIYHINIKYTNKTVFQKCIIGAFIITSIELIVGCIANIIFEMHVWDYSRVFVNFWGQICLIYSIMWFFLCIPLTRLCAKIYYIFNKEEIS